MTNKTWGTKVLTAAFVMTLATAGNAFAGAVIPEGIYVGDQSLGGMTKEEAEETIVSYVEGLFGQSVTLDVNGNLVETTAGDLGFHWSNPDAVEEAAGAYEGGNLIKQYMAQKDLKEEPVVVELETAVDQEKVAAFVAEKCQGLTAEPQNASITREAGEFVITPSADGVAVDVEATKAALDEALKTGLDQPVTVKAVVAVEEPAIKTEDLETIGDALGTFTTSFSSSGAARSTNVTVGAGKINGRVLMPGETLSGYECMHPFTKANGYKAAAAYENGQVVDSIGGGVCQISTTLYNAALYSELEITQRQNHSMTVSYVKPSMDAAIAGTYKDLKITNNYSTPIYIEGYTEGKKLTFTIYGKETRPENRTVEFVSETLKVNDPGAPQEIPDPSLAPGARVRVQSGHTGLKSRLWKVVKVDGVETERTLLNTDTYNASKAIYRVGPAAPEPVPEVPADGNAVVPEGTAPEEGGAPEGGTAPSEPSEVPAGPGAEITGPGGTEESPGVIIGGSGGPEA